MTAIFWLWLGGAIVAGLVISQSVDEEWWLPLVGVLWPVIPAAWLIEWTKDAVADARRARRRKGKSS